MIEQVVNSLKIEIPEVYRKPIPTDLPIINLNPQCGPMPLTSVEAYKEEDYFNFKAVISNEFIEAQIIPRGRPHFALLHVALIDDNLASLCFSLFTGEAYGQKYRYLERGVAASFKKEAFIRGALEKVPWQAIEVDGYEIKCELIKSSPRRSLDIRGIFRVVIIGLADKDKIDVACWEGEYFRRKGVLNLKT